MQKPREIGRFAALALTACLINVVSTLMVLNFARRGWLATAIGAGIVIGLILWVAVGRSLMARLVLTIWLAFGVGAGIAGYAMILVTHSHVTMSPLVHALSVATIALNCVALFFLWSKPSTSWLQTKLP
jgi:uncharacterized membrane protein